MFITDGHPVALEDILGWMIFSGEDIADIRCFLVGLVTEDNWQYDHGDNIHKKMTGNNWQIDHGNNSHKRVTGDNWQNDHGDDSQCWETGSSCNRYSVRLGPKAKLLLYVLVQGGHHEERLLLQKNIMRKKQERTKEFRQQAENGIWRCDMLKDAQKQQHKKVAWNKRNRNWQGSRHNEVEAVNQVFGANEVEIKQESLKALRLLRLADHALDEICEYLADRTEYM